MDVDVTLKMLLPNEVSTINHLTDAFFESIGYKEAIENPEPERILMANYCQSPFSQVWVGVNKRNYEVGYIWFRIANDVYNKPFLFIEQIYIQPHYRSGFSIMSRLIEKGVEMAKRTNCQKGIVEVNNIDNQKVWSKLGFKPRKLTMQFTGDVVDFSSQKIVSWLNKRNGGK